ncbi:uncharacterized protein LOC100838907 [Brachypodium distachyon]|uniref:F-box domain-containing protein n=1 Tax=Brachypodium distachyon TaxID=15368 RepID=I1HWZ6_BRADI|nr:uncharacterized protein LOC100838907 [Brachypodium distachyon]KQJ93217.1 hypothetical protein BRADI_3g03220v3 [Brachypodium distachyon]|eukprot:XP_010233784.1 uncharacterized protein LOC100838907 [Brachypodium distachyon]
MVPPAPHLLDEILEEIFLRLPTPDALARVSTACATFRRVITERAFLRRFRKRHPPPLLGLINDDAGGFRPAEAPHPSARLARALLDAADFTYSFVPKPKQGWLSPWHPRDVRDGRVLLNCRTPGRTVRIAFAVCDPLSRRYVLLPPLPDDDLAVQEGAPAELAPVLAPVGDDGDETSFKVICMASFKSKVVAFVFSSDTRQWRIAASPSWSSLGTDRPHGLRNCSYHGCRGLSCFDYVRGCMYSAAPWLDKLLVLDMERIQFSTINYTTRFHIGEVPYGHAMYSGFRPGTSRSLPGIVVGTEGALELFSLVEDVTPNGPSCLYHTTLQNNSEHWQLTNVISLPHQHHYFTVGAAEGFLFLGGTASELDCDDETERLETWPVDYFSLEVRTSELKKICRMTKAYFNHERVHSYFGFPPSLSKPSI